MNIRELSEKEIADRFKENPEHWTTDDKGIKLSNELGQARLATSVILEIWSKGKFSITDPNAFVVAVIKPSI